MHTIADWLCEENHANIIKSTPTFLCFATFQEAEFTGIGEWTAVYSSNTLF